MTLHKSTLLLLTLCSGQLLAQDAAPPATPVPPAAPAPLAPSDPAAVPTPPVPKPPTAAARGSTSRKRMTILGGAGAQAGDLAGGLAVTAAEGKSGTSDKSIRVWDSADPILPRMTRTGRTLVVSSTQPDPAALASGEEDISVMALILRKAIGSVRSEDRRVALGIELDSTVFGSSSGARNIYLDGYGALFLLGVRFPLIAPPEGADSKEARENMSNDWAEAREEYLSGSLVRPGLALEQLVRFSGSQAAEEYDPEKVQNLKTAVLQAMKNAAHIRILKPSDAITVVIQGGDIGRREKAGSTSSAGRARNTANPSETVMTVRVRKADVDALAAGKLDLEAFGKKAEIQTYLRRGDSPVGTATFISSPGR